MINSIRSGNGLNFYDEAVNDSEAWRALTGGDRGAYEFLFRKYYDDLYRYAVKFSGRSGMAEDHIQKLFLKIWRRRDKLQEVEAVKTYLWTALRRSMIDTFRREKAERKYVEKYKNNSRMQYSAEELVIRNEVNTIQSKELKEAIARLTSREREVLYLKFYEGMCYEEIEQIMSVSYQTSRNYVYRALQSLKSILGSMVVPG
ncbi:MAG TPA: sigma-70 family RNA polymerase sigma factor [Fodinibius sp.]|nr:sigma-70 family RNA polymerase sigma factor [Fodinibius sp.]